MIKLVIFFGILTFIFILATVLIFRHEIETLAHKYGLRDEVKHLKHLRKRKEAELRHAEKSIYNSYEIRSIQNEIQYINEQIINIEETK